MLDILNGMESFFDLSWLVSVGDFYEAKCADIGGSWITLADNTYQCVHTNFDAKVGAVVADVIDKISN